MSISGVSGVATKTSFALFFLRVLTASARRRRGGRGEPPRARVQRQGRGPAVARQAERRFTPTTGPPRAGARLGVAPAPFPSVRVLGAASREASPTCRARHRRPARGRRRVRVDTAGVRGSRGCSSSASPTRTTRRTSSPFVRERVQEQLRRFAVDIAAGRARSCCATRATRPDGRWHGPVAAAPASRSIADLPTLVDALEPILEPEEAASPIRRGPARVQPGTVSAFLRRLHAASARLGHLVRAGDSTRIDRDARQRHGRRDPVAARTGAAVRRRRAAERDVPAEGGDRPAPAAVGDRARRAEQVRAARGHEPAEGHADRHRAARPIARRSVGRRAADARRRSRPRCWRTRHPGQRPARRRRGRAGRVRMDAAVDACPRAAAQAGHDGASASRPCPCRSS